MSKLSNKMLAIIIFVFIFTGIILMSFDYLKSKKQETYEKIRISLYVNEEKDNTPQNITEEQPVEVLPNDYIGILTIDKINLSQGFHDKTNPNNDISQTIAILDTSNYPDEANGNTILVAHSGSSHIAYFKHLYQLVVGDIATIRYKGKTYTYKIENIYNEEKDGDVTIYRNTSKSTLTMITCTKDDDTKQTVYIAYLQKVE